LSRALFTPFYAEKGCAGVFCLPFLFLCTAAAEPTVRAPDRFTCFIA
jgi:hypothetical protein